METNIMLSIDDFCSEPKHLENMEKVVALINEFRIKPTIFTIPLYENKYSIFDLKYPQIDEILEHCEIACHGLTHVGKDGGKSNEMLGVSAKEFETNIGKSIDMLKDKFGKKPVGYKAPGWIVECEQAPIIEKHFKWMQINELGTNPRSHEGFFFFPITYDLFDVGSFITPMMFITSHLTNGNNENVLNITNYLKFRNSLNKLKKHNFKINFMTLSELMGKLKCQH